MSRKRIIILVTCAAVMVMAPAQTRAQGTPPEAAATAIDQRALDMLKKMSDTISQAKNVSFQARSMVPVRTPGPAGVWINLYGMSKVVVQGRDKLFASTGGDLAAHDFYYDGKTITMLSPDKNLYAVKGAPVTIDAMIEKAYNEDGKSFPYADLLLADPYAVLTKGLTGALYVGQSTIVPLASQRGVKTNHLAFANKGVEWQIWIDQNDHLPRLVVATYLDVPGEPSYSVEFGDWKLNDTVDPDTFVFKNTTNASRIEFRNPFQGRRMGAADAAAKE